MVNCPKLSLAVRMSGAFAAFMVTTSIGTGVDWFAPKPFSAELNVVQLEPVLVTGGDRLRRVVVTGQSL
jgi:hypothetical protein